MRRRRRVRPDRAGSPASADGRRSRCRVGRRVRGSTRPGPGGAGSGKPASASSVLRPTSSGIWSVLAYWCANGSSGTSMPTIAPISGPQKPAHDTTMSAGIVPLDVATPVTRPPLCSIPVTLVDPRNTAPRAWARRATATTTRDALASPSVGTYSPPRIFDSSTSGCSRTHSSGSSTVPSIPHEVAQPCRRCSSARRSGVVATSRPPSWLKHHSPSRSMPTNFSTVYRANSVIVFDPRWSGRPVPGACEVEPPVNGNGPWSTTVT